MEDVAKTALQCSLKIRQGRKWKNRRCVLSKRSPIADQLTLSFYKDEDHVTKEVRRERIIITDKNFCGIDSGHHYHGNSYITTVVCVDQIIALSFHCSATQLQWYHRIKHSLKSLIEYKCRVVIPNRVKLPAGPAMLYFFDSHFAITSEVPIRLYGAWYLEDIQRYGTIAGGIFFETKQKKRGYSNVLMTSEATDLKFHFDAAFNTWLPNRWSHLSSTLSISEDHFTRGRSATNNSAYSQGAHESNNRRNSGDAHDGNGASSSYYQTSGVSREEGIGSGSIHEPGSSTSSSNSGTPVKSPSLNGNTISALDHIGHLYNAREYSQESGIDMHILPVVGQDSEVEETAVLPFKEQLYEVMASFKNLRQTTNGTNQSGANIIPKPDPIRVVIPSKNDSVHHNMYVNMDDLPEEERTARLNNRQYLQEKDAELLERVKRECRSPEAERNSKLITPKYQGLKIKEDQIQHQKDDVLNNVQYVKSSQVTSSHLQDHVDTYILIPGVLPQTGAASLPIIEPPPLGPKPKSSLRSNSDSETIKPQLGPKPKQNSEIKPEIGPKPPVLRPPEVGPKPGPKPGQGPKPELGPKPEYCAFPEIGPKPEPVSLPDLGPEHSALPELGPKPDFTTLPELGPKPRSDFLQKELGSKQALAQEQSVLPEMTKDIFEDNKSVVIPDELPNDNCDNSETQITIPAPFEHDNLTIPTTAIFLSQTVKSETKPEPTQDEEASNLIATKLSKSAKKQKHSSPKAKSKRNFMRGRSGSLKSKPESYGLHAEKPIYRNRSASVMTFQFDQGQYDGSSQSSSSLSSPTGLEPPSNFEFSPYKTASPVDLDSVVEDDGSALRTESEIKNIPEETPLLPQGPPVVPPLPPKSAHMLSHQKAPPRPAKPSKIGNPFLAADPQPVIPPRKRCQTEPSQIINSDGFVLLDPDSKGDDGYALMKPAYLEKLQNTSDITYQSPTWSSMSPVKSSLDTPPVAKISGSFSHKFSFNVVPNSPIHTSVDIDTPVSTKPQLKRSATMVGASLVSPRMQRTYSLHGENNHVHENIRRGSVPALKPDETSTKASSSNSCKPEKRRIPTFRPRTDGEYHAIDTQKLEKIKNGFAPENSIYETPSNGRRANAQTSENLNQCSNEKSSYVSENNLSGILSITCSTGFSNKLDNMEAQVTETNKRKRCLACGDVGADHAEDKNIIDESLSKFSLLNYVDGNEPKSSLLGSIDKVFEKYSSYKVNVSEGDLHGEILASDTNVMESAFID